jgi:hypothetical protein
VPGTVVVTLPASAQILPGQTVRVTGTSANSWQIAQNAGQTVLTTGMAGNVLPAATWTARLTPQTWHWMSSNAAGDILVAGEAQGELNISTNGGDTWTPSNIPLNSLTWIASDMSATGDIMMAAQYQGNLYMSIDRGTTWTPVTSTASGINLTAQPYESISLSRSGQRIVVGVQNGPVYVSSNAGATWVTGTLVGGAALTGWWRSVDSSRTADPLTDGMVAMAVDQNGDIVRSTDGGLTWALRNVVVGGLPVRDSWYRLQMSDDGNIVVAVGNSFGTSAAGTGIYVSRDAGATWTRAHALVADYTAVAMSGDGQTITVTVSNANPIPPAAAGSPARASGRVLRSTDGGLTFVPVTMPGTDTNWRATAMSSDGNKLAVAAGSFVGPVFTGQLYTSLGNRTEAGASGSITGGQGLTAEFEYVGNGQYRVKSSSGGAFAIQ